MFYAHMNSKRDALQQAAKLFFERLVATTAGAFFAVSASWSERVWRAGAAVAEFIVAAPTFARLALIDAYAPDAAAARHADELLFDIAVFIERCAAVSPDGPVPPLAVRAILASLTEIVLRLLATDRVDELPGMLPLATYVTVVPFIGARRATTSCRRSSPLAAPKSGLDTEPECRRYRPSDGPYAMFCGRQRGSWSSRVSESSSFPVCFRAGAVASPVQPTSSHSNRRARTPSLAQGRPDGPGQRERLIDAVIHLSAKMGSQSVSVAQISSEAGVSSATFYEQFENKEVCLLAAHGTAAERLLVVQPPTVADGDWIEAARETLREFADALQRNPTRGGCFRRHAGGRPARASGRGAAISAFDRRVQEFVDSTPADGPWLDVPAVALLGATRSIIARSLRTRGESELPALADDGVAWVLSYAVPSGTRRWSTGPRSLLPSPPPPRPLHERADLQSAYLAGVTASPRARRPQPPHPDHLRHCRGGPDQGLPGSHRRRHRGRRGRLERGLLRALRGQAGRLPRPPKPPYATHPRALCRRVFQRDVLAGACVGHARSAARDDRRESPDFTSAARRVLRRGREAIRRPRKSHGRSRSFWRRATATVRRPRSRPS